MNLEKIILNQCNSIRDIPVNNLEDLDVTFCIGSYINSKGKEVPIGYVELKIEKYNFSDYEELKEAIIIAKNKERFSLIPIKGEIKDYYDIITKPNEANILNSKEILNSSRKLKRMKSNLFYSINNFFSDREKELKEKEAEVLYSLKYFLKEPYKKAIVEYL